MANRRDVNLVIKAKDEGTKAIEAFAATLQSLLGVNDKLGASTAKTGSRLEELASVAITVDKAYAKISGAADTAAAAFGRQQAALNESRSQLASLRSQAEAAAKSIERLNGADAIVDAGRDQSGRIAQLKQVTLEYERLQNQQSKLQSTIVGLEGALNSQRSSLQQIGSISIAAADARDRLTIATERETQALREQAAAASVAARINKTVGVTRETGDMDDLVRQLRAQSEAHDNLITKLRAEEAATAELARTQEAQKRAASFLPGNTATGNSARVSAAVFEQADADAAREVERATKAAAAAEDEMASAAARLRAQIDPLGNIQDRLNKELAEANALYKAGKISATELAGATALLKGNADRAMQALNGSSGLDSRGRPSLFGLKPYELQNFGYQINDVVTQIASGTSVTQTLAQQGGQILQLFPRVGAAIVAAFSSPLILGAAAAVGVLIGGLKTAADEADRLRTFEGALRASADGASYQATALSAATRALDNYGLSAKDAIAVVKIFQKEGLDPARLLEFGKTAQDMSDVLGIDVPEAAKKLTDAFTGSYDEVKKLDNEINFLSATQRANIKEMFEQGRAAEAQAAAVAILSGRYQEAADKQRGPWADATRSFSAAWNDLWSSVGNSGVITNTINGLARLTNGLTAFINRLRGVQNLQDVMNQKNELATSATGRVMKALNPQGYYAEMKRLTDLETRLYQEQQKGVAAGAIRLENTERSTKATEDLVARTQALAAASKTASDADRLAAAEKEALREANADLAADGLKYASEASKEEYRRQKIGEARRAVEEKITAENKAQAREARAASEAAKREAEQRRKGYVADLNDNGREKLVATAQRFNGMSETRNRGDLMSFFKSNGINVDPKMTAWCAAFVNAVLATNGLPGTGKLNAKSFLGYGSDATSNPQVGDIVILNRGPNAAQGHVGFFQGFDENGNVKVLGGNQSDGVNTKSFKRNDVVGIRRAPSAGQVAQAEYREEVTRDNKQTEFNEKLRDENELRKLSIESLQSQGGLIGEALIVEQRRQAVAEAVLKAEQKAADDGLTFSPEQRAEIERTTAAYFDLAHAKDVAAAKRAVVEQPVDDLTAQRDALQQQIEFLRETGQAGLADQLVPQLDAVNLKLAEAINKAREFWTAVAAGQYGGAAAFGMTAEQVQNLIIKLDTAKQSTQSLGTFMGISLGTIAQNFASGVAGAFDKFAQAVAEGKDVMGSLKDAFLQFASDFLRQIAQMIIQQTIFNLVSGLLKSVGGGVGAPVAHGGGMVSGAMGVNRTVSPAWFAGAQRYHTGGIAGLKPNEVPAILERGEEVLTRDDPRHSLNGGAGGGGGVPNIKIINAIDAGDMVSQGLNTSVGEKAILNVLRNNAGAVRQAMGSG